MSIETALYLQVIQFVDSPLASTREFWRKKLGLRDDIARDPRPLADIIADIIDPKTISEEPGL